MDSTIAKSYSPMTDTSASKASPSHRWIKNQNVFDLPGNIVEYQGPLEDLTRALHIKNLGEHKAVQLTFTQVPADNDSEAQMALFLFLLMKTTGRVCALDMSLPRDAEGWFRRGEHDNGPRRFEHIRKLYIRFPREPEDQSPNESKDQSPKVSLEQVTQLLKDSLAPDNKFPNLEELHISGLDEDSIRKAVAEENASIGRRLFMVLIDGPEAYYSARLASLCRKFERGPEGESIAYHVVTSRDSEDDSEDGIVIKWEKEKVKELPMLSQVPESNTGSPP